MDKDPQDITANVPSIANTRSGQDRRLAFIDFRLRWEGRINRSNLTDFFGISVPQASLDIARYRELMPQNLEYNQSLRVYLATGNFNPLYPETQPDHYLNELLAATEGTGQPDTSFIGWKPPVDSVPRPGRTVAATTLVTLLMAIKEVKGLKVSYQSMSGPAPSHRTISPHALAYDGFRWHVRAFCHTRQDFRDFVLGRILEVEDMQPAGAPASDDVSWNTFLTLVLAPNPNLSPGRKHAIELDYGMNNGEVQLTCRQALLFYTLRSLGLDQQVDARAEAQQIVLKNQEEIAPFLTRSTESN